MNTVLERTSTNFLSLKMFLYTAFAPKRKASLSSVTTPSTRPNCSNTEIKSNSRGQGLAHQGFEMKGKRVAVEALVSTNLLALDKGM